MQAVIFAAGKGTRLAPFTEEMPKPLLKIKGKAILEYTFENLPDKIREIILVIGYKGDQIKNYFGEKWQGKKISYIRQPELKGTFNALACARPFLKPEPFLVLVGDDLYKKEDLEELVKHPAAVLVKETDKPERFGICQVDGNGFLTALMEKPQYPCGNLAHTGAVVMDQKIFDEKVILGPKGEEVLAPMIGSLAKKQPVKVVAGTFWFPIGYPEDLEKAQNLV